MISGPVYAELLAEPHSSGFLRDFLELTGIEADWTYPEALWRNAGAQFYLFCRSRGGSGLRRRILADVLITVHAAWRCGRLLSFDRGLRGLKTPGLQVLEL